MQGFRPGFRRISDWFCECRTERLTFPIVTRYFDQTVLPEALGALLQRSGVSLSIADFTSDDCPLVGVNEAFCKLSGYEPEEILGRNCRFLQPEGGAGPVRERMRNFLTDEKAKDGKFLIPNVTKDGDRFLNLVYMSKLTRNGEVSLVLGSQFAVDLKAPERGDLYDRALQADLRQLNLLITEHNWTVLGSFEALASSHSIIAQARME